MSLVNQMLRDLERRRAGERHGAGSIFHGIISTGEPRRTRGPLLALVLLVALLSGAVAYLLWDRRGAEPVPPLASVPVAPVATMPIVASQAVVPPAAAPAGSAPISPAMPAPTPAGDGSVVAPAVPPPAASSLAAATPLRAEAAPSPATEPVVPKDVPKKSAARKRAAKPAEAAPTVTAPVAPAIDKKPVPPTAEQLGAMAYQRGYEALRNGQREDAERELREALRHDAEHIPARESLAGLLLSAGRRVEASEVLESGLAKQPGVLAFRKLHARLLVEQGDVNAAVASLEAGAEGANGDSDYQALLAALYQRQGAFEKSVQRYQQALTQEPRQGVWWLGLAISSEGAGRTQDAAAAYMRALESGIGAKLGAYARERLKALETAAKSK